MKNIHVLPTDKSSRVFITKKEGLGFDNQMLENVELDCQNQNIYITSDEEIKEGWEGHAYKEDVEGKVFKHFYTTNEWYKDAKKIILTTDQDLVKDGVQAIPDEFLEWFVKNPSCEFIEIKHFGKCCCNPFISQCVDCKKYNPQYKIIIPKEESKQCDICKMYPRLEGTNKCESCYSVIRHFLEQDPELKDSLLPDLRKKQETLEEITEQIQKDCHKFVESIISKVTYQDATNTFLFMKLAELTLKLKKYE